MITGLRHLNIEITRRCDQHCTYCFNDSGPEVRQQEMSVNQWLAVVNHVATGGLESIHVTGGEPFISSTTVPLLSEAQRLGLSTSILSNGLRIADVAEKYPNLLSQLTVAQISLDSMDAADHDKRRGKPGAWNQAMMAINVLKKLRVPIELSCTVDLMNIQSVDDLASYSREIGASLILRPVIGLGRAYPTLTRSMQESLKYWDRKHADILVCDRFCYVPASPNSDEEAFKHGILTILPDGRFRTGAVTISGTDQATSTTELLEAA